jgi:WD40 repeat protein
VNVKLDHATALGFSADSKYLVAALANSKELVFYGISEGKDGRPNATQLHVFPTEHKSEIKNVCFPPSNNFVVTFGQGQDTQVKIWTPKGKLEHTINTNQIENVMGCISRDGKFVAAATRMGDVKVWLVRNREGKKKEGVEAEIAMTLKGHKKKVACVAFGGVEDGKTARMATTCLDGTWRHWNAGVRYEVSEDPKVVFEDKPSLGAPGQVALSPSYETPVIAVSIGPSLLFYHAKTHALLETVETAHRGGVKLLKFSDDGNLATTGEDKAVKLWAVSKLL